MNNLERLNLNKNQVLFLEGEDSTDLFYIEKGSALVVTQQGTQVTPLAEIKEGEFIGELSFFDGSKRSATIIANDESTFLKIPKHEFINNFPEWLKSLALSMSNKLRLLDHSINSHGIKKRKNKKLKGLTIDEQISINNSIKTYSQNK